ncbi:uncharacterized protein BKA55DRAFT_664916 [Fusarium redolens]|uniref:Uncharacterized protein n=1 Tax=Fusarium redolens TaxID=48865 RepID=A0A9P9K4S8_FUSRE|nr:uncharacterized protein BKA55DRAFT_664916 [Fusarium redolens]KAH7244226.1 hypothetical protein BKA55DRAFT_664916 [Fusarium redolens]
MRLPLEHIINASPFIQPTNQEEAIKAQEHHRDLLNLVVSCKSVYNNNRHLLFTCLILENATDIVAALANIVKHPQVGPSIRHIRCSTELHSETERYKALEYWLLNHSQDAALLQDTLKAEGLRPPWWNEMDVPWTCWEGFVYDDCTEVALLAILYMVTELETLSFQQLDAGLITDWEQVRDLRASFAQARPGTKPFLNSLRGLQFGEGTLGGMEKLLPVDPHDNLEVLVLDCICIQNFSRWSSYFDFKEWVNGEWVTPGPKELEAQSELFLGGEEARRLSVAEARDTMDCLKDFRNLRVLDVVFDRPPDWPSRSLIALENIASGSLQVLRIEGYPFKVELGGFGPCNSEYERAFITRLDTVE